MEDCMPDNMDIEVLTFSKSPELGESIFTNNQQLHHLEAAEQSKSAPDHYWRSCLRQDPGFKCSSVSNETHHVHFASPLTNVHLLSSPEESQSTQDASEVFEQFENRRRSTDGEKFCRDEIVDENIGENLQIQNVPDDDKNDSIQCCNFNPVAYQAGESDTYENNVLGIQKTLGKFYGEDHLLDISFPTALSSASEMCYVSINRKVFQNVPSIHGKSGMCDDMKKDSDQSRLTKYIAGENFNRQSLGPAQCKDSYADTYSSESAYDVKSMFSSDVQKPSNLLAKEIICDILNCIFVESKAKKEKDENKDTVLTDLSMSKECIKPLSVSLGMGMDTNTDDLQKRAIIDELPSCTGKRKSTIDDSNVYPSVVKVLKIKDEHLETELEIQPTVSKTEVPKSDRNNGIIDTSDCPTVFPTSINVESAVCCITTEDSHNITAGKDNFHTAGSDCLVITPDFSDHQATGDNSNWDVNEDIGNCHGAGDDSNLGASAADSWMHIPEDISDCQLKAESNDGNSTGSDRGHYDVVTAANDNCYVTSKNNGNCSATDIIDCHISKISIAKEDSSKNTCSIMETDCFATTDNVGCHVNIGDNSRHIQPNGSDRNIQSVDITDCHVLSGSPISENDGYDNIPPHSKDYQATEDDVICHIPADCNDGHGTTDGNISFTAERSPCQVMSGNSNCHVNSQSDCAYHIPADNSDGHLAAVNTDFHTSTECNDCHDTAEDHVDLIQAAKGSGCHITSVGNEQHHVKVEDSGVHDTSDHDADHILSDNFDSHVLTDTEEFYLPTDKSRYPTKEAYIEYNNTTVDSHSHLAADNSDCDVTVTDSQNSVIVHSGGSHTPTDIDQQVPCTGAFSISSYVKETTNSMFDIEAESPNGVMNYGSSKLYTCDMDLLDQDGFLLCSPVEKKAQIDPCGSRSPLILSNANSPVLSDISSYKEGATLTGSFFGWKQQTPENSAASMDTLPSIPPLATCRKPLRIGLSRKQKIKSLHHRFQPKH